MSEVAPESAGQPREDASAHANGGGLIPCRQCGVQFAPTKPWQHFHSDTCRRAWHKRQEQPIDRRLDDLERQLAELKHRLEAIERCPAVAPDIP